MTDNSGVEIILACGHESDYGRALTGVLPNARLAPAGRELSVSVDAVLRESTRPVCVLPMTFGRNPKLIADSARALNWVGGDRVVLAEPFGTPDHLIGWLRAKAVQAVYEQALLITAPTGDPFEDAELFRIARLVRQYGRHQWVEVALIGGDPDVSAGVERCRRLGAEHVAVAPAWFGPALQTACEDAVDAGPLLTPSAVRGVVTARVAAALSRLARGDNGIHAGMDAEHGHGYAHSHGPGEGDHVGDHHHPHTHHHEHAHS